jgi:hypothetical protein
MADNTLRWAIIAIAGLVIFLFNLYWLVSFEGKWNLFTMESWFMLIVGLLLIIPVLLPPEKPKKKSNRK